MHGLVSFQLSSPPVHSHYGPINEKLLPKTDVTLYKILRLVYKANRSHLWNPTVGKRVRIIENGRGSTKSLNIEKAM